ncbi:MAG TPA: HD domain-containing phosphohydrolase [Gammaproteobacteria bacterium]
MNRRVLFVDDEPAVLEAIRRNLRRDFDVFTESDPRAALAALEGPEPFAVIVADMRMPGMDGVELLYQARKRSPDSVRLMLTGDADRATAVGAVNRGDVYKFLTKPCDAELLRKVVELAVRRYDRNAVEKEMLENTVRASVRALAEVLALAKPLAFGRVHRLRTIARAVGARLPGCDAWELDTAALLSQLGTVSLPQAVLEKRAAGRPLSARERAQYLQHPVQGAELVRKIPRLERVADAILYQLKNYDGSGVPADGVRGDAIPLSARILRLALAYDEERSGGRSATDALAAVTARRDRFDPRALEALAATLGDAVPDAIPVPPGLLECGMVIEQDVSTDEGVLLVCRGQEVTVTVRTHLQRFHEAGSLSGPVLVSMPARRYSPPETRAAKGETEP